MESFAFPWEASAIIEAEESGGANRGRAPDVSETLSFRLPSATMASRQKKPGVHPKVPAHTCEVVCTTRLYLGSPPKHVPFRVEQIWNNVGK